MIISGETLKLFRFVDYLTDFNFLLIIPSITMNGASKAKYIPVDKIMDTKTSPKKSWN